MIRKARFLASATAVAALGVAMTAAPGAAGPSTINLTVGGGALVINAPATITGSGSLGGTPQLPVSNISINDGRGTLAGWTATVTATDLTTGGGDDPGETISNATMIWTTTGITPNNGQASIAVPAAGTLGGPVVAAVGLPAISAGSFTLNGRVDVPIPATNVAGEYTGTLTTSIS